MITLTIVIFLISFYIEYIICQTNKFSMVFFCFLGVQVILSLLDGTFSSVYLNFFNLGTKLISVFISALVAFIIYKKTNSFWGYFFGNMIFTLLLLYTIPYLSDFLSFLSEKSFILALCALGAIALLIIIAVIIFYKKYASEKKEKVEDEPVISAPAGCPSCGRALESDMTRCPYCGYNFENFTKMYQDAILEKQNRR